MAEVGDWGLGWLVRVAEEGARAAVKVDVGARATGDGGLRWSRRRRCEAEAGGTRGAAWRRGGLAAVGRKRRWRLEAAPPGGSGGGAGGAWPPRAMEWRRGHRRWIKGIDRVWCK